MHPFPDTRHVERALARTRQRLGLAAGAPLSPEEASVLLKYLLLEGWSDGDRPSSRAERAHGCGLQGRFAALLDQLYATPPPHDALAAALRVAASAPRCRARILDLAREAAWGEPLAPETCLSPEPIQTAAAVPPGSHRHLVIFASAARFTHEFYPLAVDAYVRDVERHGRITMAVLGVHADWLEDEGASRRALFLDPVQNRLIESDWVAPIRPHSVQFLCLGCREQRLHRTLGTRFDCLQLNPGAPSELADDKSATLAGWSPLGVEIPHFRRVEPGEGRLARAFADEFAECVIKPNRGTEGLGVGYLTRSTPGLDSELSLGLRRCWQFGPAIIQQRRDGVLFRDPAHGTTHTLALRLNLVFDGRRHRLASGFAQIGTDSAQPASCGRGGRTLALEEALQHLVARGDSARPVAGPDRSLWADIQDCAEQAAGLFEGLWLVGLDVLLDLDAAGRLVPVFLEANPRPAGLCHSRLLSGLPSRADPPGVGPALWDGLAARCCDRRLRPKTGGRRDAFTPSCAQ